MARIAVTREASPLGEAHEKIEGRGLFPDVHLAVRMIGAMFGHAGDS